MICCVINRESYEDRKRREHKREMLLKKRRVEVLDINHNNELQKETASRDSLETTFIEVGNETIEDIDDNENSRSLQHMTIQN